MSTAASFFGLKEGFLPLLEGSQPLRDLLGDP